MTERFIRVWLDQRRGDITHALRRSSQAPGFASGVVMTLAVGVTAATVIAAVVDAVLLRPLPYSDADRIVRISSPHPQSFVRFTRAGFELSEPAVTGSPAFVAVSVHLAGGANLGTHPAIRVRATAATPSFFDVFNAAPALGRVFTEGDLSQSSDVAVLSHRLWTNRFASDPHVLSRTLLLNGRQFLIIGVMPELFDFPLGTDIWVPSTVSLLVAEGILTPSIMARVTPGVTYQQARDAFGAVYSSQGWNRSVPITITSLRDVLVGNVRSVVVALAAGALLLLFVACVNAAHLLLARVTAQAREFALRRALGASGVQLACQVLTEGLVLVLGAGVAAAIAAAWITSAFRASLPGSIHGAADIAVDLRVLVATGALCVLTTFAIGLAPALSASTRHASEALRIGAHATGSTFWNRLRSGLVIAEIAVAVVLLVGAVTVLRTVTTLTSADAGIRNSSENWSNCLGSAPSASQANCLERPTP